MCIYLYLCARKLIYCDCSYLVELDEMAVLLGATYSFQRAEVARKVQAKIVHYLALRQIPKIAEEKR